MNIVSALFLVALLISSSYAAGRLHSQLGHRHGFRVGYKHGFRDGGEATWLSPQRAMPGPAPREKPMNRGAARPVVVRQGIVQHNAGAAALRGGRHAQPD